MRTSFYLLMTIIIFACKNKVENKQTIFFYTGLMHNGNDSSETFTSNKINRHTDKDTLVTSQDFELKGTKHLIKLFKDKGPVPIDGGALYYELDSLGIIYSRSTIWYSYSRLRSNNDSINLAIDVALETILLYPKLSCYLND